MERRRFMGLLLTAGPALALGLGTSGAQAGGVGAVPRAQHLQTGKALMANGKASLGQPDRPWRQERRTPW